MGESAATRGWGSGWPYCQTSRIITVSWTQPHGTRMSLPVRAEMATIFPTLVNRLAAARGRDYTQYGSWGFACRAISGTSTSSNHAWGLAIDLEAPSNPQFFYTYGSHPHNVGAIAAGLGIRWGGPVGLGGGYTSSYDAMHFEYMGTPQTAAALTAALRRPPEAPDMTPAEMTIWATSSAGKKALATALLSGSYYEPTDGGKALSVNDALTRLLGHVEAMKTDIAALKAKAGI